MHVYNLSEITCAAQARIAARDAMRDAVYAARKRRTLARRNILACARAGLSRSISPDVIGLTESDRTALAEEMPGLYFDGENAANW